MSKHSKWAKVKNQKGVTDKKRSAIFTRLARGITVAAKAKGGDPAMNFQLRMAIDQAKNANMPKDNIERAIKKGAGEGSEAVNYEELMYEAFGPGGVGILIEVLTENRNRVASDIKHILNKYGGSLAGAGSVRWMFEQKGILQIPLAEIKNRDSSSAKASEDTSSSEFDNVGVHDDVFEKCASTSKRPRREEVEMAAIDAGAIDIKDEDDLFTVCTAPADLEKVKSALEDSGLKIEYAGLEWAAKEKVAVSDDIRAKLESLFAELEENEDVNEHYHNANI